MVQIPKTPESLADWKLERLALGQLPKAEAEALEALLADDPEAAARYEALASEQ